MVAYSFEHAAKEADLVVAVKVLRHQPADGQPSRDWPIFMDVEVLRVVAGEERRRQVRVWGQRKTPFDFRGAIVSLRVGSFWLLDLNRLKNTVPAFGVAAGLSRSLLKFVS